MHFLSNVTDFPLSAPPPCLLVTHERNIVESGTLREVHMLIYPDPPMSKTGQFHQHFMSSFFANILSPKNYEPKL
jgi:hypothetical protein